MDILKKCINCKKTKKLFSKKSRLCRSCYSKSKMIECSVCQNVKKVYTRKSNLPVCENCSKRKCSRCGNIRVIKNRDESLCSGCLMEKNKKICDLCRFLKKIYYSKEITMCCNCYQKCNKHSCIECKKLKPVNKRDVNGRPICQECVRRCGMCARCKKNRKLKTKDDLCATCRSKNNKEYCVQCNKLKIVVKRTDGNKSICPECYEKDRKKTDINYRVRKDVRRRIALAISNKIYCSLYDIDYDAISNHLGSIPDKNKTYHIDHIFPLSAFNLLDRIEFKIATSPENHQWLEAGENMKKGAKYDSNKLSLFKKITINKYNLA